MLELLINLTLGLALGGLVYFCHQLHRYVQLMKEERKFLLQNVAKIVRSTEQMVRDVERIARALEDVEIVSVDELMGSPVYTEVN